MSTAVAARPTTELLTGRPEQWATDGALLFGLTPWISVLLWALHAQWLHSAGWVSLAIVPWGEILGLSLCMGAAGAVGGWLLPVVLERLRGRVPLWLIAPLVGTSATALAMGAGAVSVGLFGSEALLALVAAAAVGAVATVGWLPYTVAMVLRGPARLVLGAGVLVALPLAWELVRMLVIAWLA